MGYFSQTLAGFAQKAKAYANVGLRHASGAIGFIKRGLGETNALVSRILETAANMPVLADIARKLQESPHFQRYRELSSELDSALDSAASIVNTADEYMNRQSGVNNHLPNPHLSVPEVAGDMPVSG
jgi:hypothetical protein